MQHTKPARAAPTCRRNAAAAQWRTPYGRTTARQSAQPRAQARKHTDMTRLPEPGRTRSRVAPIAARAAADARADRHLRAVVWVGAVQVLLALSWTTYALLLPGFAARAGIAPGWVVWILIADQAIFAATDWAAGVCAQRVAVHAGRIARLVCAPALLAAFAFAAMPPLAGLGSPLPLLAAIVLWAAASSFVRAPAYALLGRIGGTRARTRAVGWSLVGISVATALGPLLTDALRGAGTWWPIGIASLGPACAGLVAVAVDRRVPSAPTAPAPAAGARTGSGAIGAVAMFLAAFGAQWHVTVASTRMAIGFGLPARVALFGLGFAAGIALAMRIAGTRRAHALGALLLGAGAVALIVAARTTWAPLFVLVQLGAGAAWGFVFVSLLGSALAPGRAAGWLSPLGVLLSAVAVAALVRLAIGALGWQATPAAGHAPAVAWLLGALALALHAPDRADAPANPFGIRINEGAHGAANDDAAAPGWERERRAVVRAAAA